MVFNWYFIICFKAIWNLRKSTSKHFFNIKETHIFKSLGEMHFVKTYIRLDCLTGMYLWVFKLIMNFFRVNSIPNTWEVVIIYFFNLSKLCTNSSLGFSGVKKWNMLIISKVSLWSKLNILFNFIIRSFNI